MNSETEKMSFTDVLRLIAAYLIMGISGLLGFALSLALLLIPIWLAYEIIMLIVTIISEMF